MHSTRSALSSLRGSTRTPHFCSAGCEADEITLISPDLYRSRKWAWARSQRCGVKPLPPASTTGGAEGLYPLAQRPLFSLDAENNKRAGLFHSINTFVRQQAGPVPLHTAPIRGQVPVNAKCLPYPIPHRHWVLQTYCRAALQAQFVLMQPLSSGWKGHRQGAAAPAQLRPADAESTEEIGISFSGGGADPAFARCYSSRPSMRGRVSDRLAKPAFWRAGCQRHGERVIGSGKKCRFLLCP